jgi:hypothetical protein
MKTRIHVNQHAIKRNRKRDEREPVITVKDYKRNRKGHDAIIRDADGVEVARVVYRPDAPLPCGAHVWIETENSVEVL